MERTAGLEQGLIDTSTTGHDTNGRTAAARQGLLRTAGQTNAGLVLIGLVSDDSSVVPRRPRERTAVADLLLQVADDGTFGALREGKDVADGKRRLLAAVDECTSVKTLSCNKGLFAELVAVRVPENDAGEGSTTDFAFS